MASARNAVKARIRALLRISRWVNTQISRRGSICGDDSLTRPGSARRVWSEIAAGDYVAQAYAPPSLRGISQAGERSKLKVDIRLYTYAGKLLIAAARLYQGQTTNMRTPGGGFAPVLVVAE